jgi:hypothetical protein
LPENVSFRYLPLADCNACSPGDGDITSLSGPGQEVAAIYDNTALTITAAKDVTVTGDIL